MTPCSECAVHAFGIFLTLASGRVLCSVCWRDRERQMREAAAKAAAKPVRR